MNIVISDTTALIILAKSDKLELLSNLFEKVFIPKAVEDELNCKDDIVKYRVEKFNKISVKNISDTKILNRIKKLNIDKGEIEAISLAIELDLKLIIDERKGRIIAINQGLDVVGVLGILVENYKLDYISFEEAHYFFNLFKKSGLRVNKRLEDIILQKLSELKK
jgi:predicted nucleic acid-binding protein